VRITQILILVVFVVCGVCFFNGLKTRRIPETKKEEYRELPVTEVVGAPTNEEESRVAVPLDEPVVAKSEVTTNNEEQKKETFQNDEMERRAYLIDECKAALKSITTESLDAFNNSGSEEESKAQLRRFDDMKNATLWGYFPWAPSIVEQRRYVLLTGKYPLISSEFRELENNCFSDAEAWGTLKQKIENLKQENKE